ncbi:MAG TPA: sodium/solute symporter [Steroidobacteraceae bacterium]|nr:sodium/solute symporter [Steroidobacteraceae bacterium]
MTPPAALSLNWLDYGEFFLFVAALSVVGFLSGRGERSSSADYFLAGRKLRWYVAGASYIAANISTEQFIGMVGASYLMGICPALYDWLNVFTFLFMIFIFVPFLLSSKVVTIPEFLARRYGPVVRQIFAFITVVANIVIFMAAVLYTGGLALSGFFGWPMPLCIILTGLFAGGWAIYGGLSSVAWTGVFTAVVKLTGASAVSILGLLAVNGKGNIIDGFRTVIERNRAASGAWQDALQHVLSHLTSSDSYNRMSVFQGADHPLTPWTGLFFLVMSVSIWYNVLNQFIIQRILGSRSLWDARMAVVFAGYVKLLLPLITVLPGLILFALHPELLRGDWLSAQHQADEGYIILVKELLPIGMRGLLLAVLFSAVQATITSVVNSTATVLTIDIYVPLFRRNATDKQLVRFGVLASVATVVLGILIAIWLSQSGGGVFQYIQTLNAFFAPPFAAIFVLGILTRRVNSTGGILAIVGGFAVGVIVKIVGALLIMPSWYYPFANQAAITWLASLALCIIGSALHGGTVDPPLAERATLWDSGPLLREGLGEVWYKSVVLWSAGFMVAILGAMFLFSDLVFPGKSP